MSPIEICTSSVRADDSTQSRFEIDVAEYAEALANGATFPPVIVFYDGETRWLADGFHRFHAHIQAKRDSILAEIQNGSRREALLYACGANADHGLRRTNADKRKAVEILLADDEWSRWSDSVIAGQCHVSRPFVNKVKASLANVACEGPAESASQLSGNRVQLEMIAGRGGTPRIYKNRHGNTAVMDVSRIGRRQQKQVDEEAEQRERSAAIAMAPEEQLAHVEKLNTDNAELLERVKVLTQDDAKAALDKERELRKLAERRHGELMTESRNQQRELQRFGSGGD